MNDSIRVSILSEALPYIQSFSGRKIVIKYGGSIMEKDNLREAFFRDVALLACVGVRPIIVHGGGPEINHWLKKLNISPKFENGLRVTDKKTMEIVEMVLMGRVNKQIVSGINKTGSLSIGLSGLDGNLIQTRLLGNGSHGLVGDITKINANLLNPLIDKGYIPVISSIGSTSEGITHNINADFVAGEIAAATNAEKLILLTDTPGILEDINKPESLLKQIKLKEARKLIDQKIVSDGMRPKTECCIRALAQGIRAAHIIDGRIEHALLLEIFTNAGIGTMINS
mgnify:FL=1|tara:strand:+ start:1640 stop:2491 length:852 start_codon:yes stop_codon:yes gene_type:complete